MVLIQSNKNTRLAGYAVHYIYTIVFLPQALPLSSRSAQCDDDVTDFEVTILCSCFKTSVD